MPADLSIFNFGSFGGGFSGGTLLNIFFYIGIIVFVIGIIGGILLFVLWLKKYRNKIVIFKKIGNNIQKVAIKRAKVINVSRAGDFLWYISGIKKYIPPALIQMAKNEYWYFIRKDGEWINFGLADIDALQKEAGAFFIDTDMRMSRITTERHLRNVFREDSFWKKYGEMMMMAGFVLIVTISLIVLFTRLSTLSDSINSLAESVKNFYEDSEILQDLVNREREDNILPSRPQNTSSSGLIPV